MKKALSLFLKYLSLFAVMGSIYYMIEIMWRGYSHISMFILAGVCGVCIGLINEVLSMDTPIWLQAIIGSCIVTIGEFISGCILNLWLGLGIWDYSNMPFNILGQICPKYTVYWFMLCAVAFMLIELRDKLPSSLKNNKKEQTPDAIL